MNFKLIKNVILALCLGVFGLFSTAIHAVSEPPSADGSLGDFEIGLPFLSFDDARYSYSYELNYLGVLSHGDTLNYSEEIIGVGEGGLIEFDRDFIIALDSSVGTVFGEILSLEGFGYDFDFFDAFMYDPASDEGIEHIDGSFSLSEDLPEYLGIHISGAVNGDSKGFYALEVSAVPLPAAAWLFISGFMALGGWSVFKRKREQEEVLSSNALTA